MGGEETITHALFECRWVKDFWAESDFADCLARAPTDFGERIGWLFQHCTRDEVRKILAWSWGIWSGRNENVFNQKNSDIGALTGGFLKLVLDIIVNMH